MKYNCKWCPFIVESNNPMILGTEVHKHLSKNHWEEMIQLGKKLKQQKKRDWTPSNDIAYFINSKGELQAIKLM